MMSRVARVWAIAVQDWRVVLGGSGWLRLPALAVAILLPAAALQLPRPPIAPPRERPPVAVSGPIPFALQGVVAEDESSEIRIVETDPIRIDGPIPDDLRRGLDRNLGSPTVQVRLTAPDDLLNTGIEVEAKPSGKNVKKLSLLSGGERSLTALAYLFAVFRSRPSPFYVMDEVEAALDDVNLHRFLDLIAEFRQEAQLIIVSHQKRTMEAADCLYGVTMQEPGLSSLVSVRFDPVTQGSAPSATAALASV